MSRAARLWRLAARRAIHGAVVVVRGRAADDEARARLDAQFAIRSAEDVARELGEMKGAIMKVGQLLSVVAEGLPPEARDALAQLQADAPPMAPGLAASVVAAELGAPPERIFADWQPIPVAAASIGQVHRGVLRDGRVVAVKVQYPGIAEAITGDLDNTQLLSALVAALGMRALDTHAIVDELRDRMTDELDYRIEAANQTRMAAAFVGHPFVRVPLVVPECSTARVLTTEWADGWTFAELRDRAPEPTRQTAAEVVFRFAQDAIHRAGVFNGDPHPGNYRFHPDGSVTFLDFGLVKAWAPGEWAGLEPVLDAVLAQDPPGLARALVRAGFLAADHRLDPEELYAYLSAPYAPYLVEEFTFPPTFVADVLGRLLDPKGPFPRVARSLNLPASFVILDRVVWGVSGLLGQLGATNRWRAILDEYRHDGPPATPLGELEATWRATAPGSTGLAGPG